MQDQTVDEAMDEDKQAEAMDAEFSAAVRAFAKGHPYAIRQDAHDVVDAVYAAIAAEADARNFGGG
jgi:hypothetical protein